MFFFPKTGRCCWFHSQVDPRGGPQFFEQQTSLRDGCFGVRGLFQNVVKCREKIWSVILLLSFFFTWNVVVRCSKGMSVEKSFSKKLIQLSYDPWMTSMLSGASHGSTHATGALRHVVWLSDVLLAQLTIRWKKTPGVTWRLELIVQILFPLGIFHLTVNLKNWMEFFQIPPLKIYALERTGWLFSEKNTWYITGRPLGQAGHGGHVGIARRSPSSLGQHAMWWCHVLSSIVRRRETKSHPGCLI